MKVLVISDVHGKTVWEPPLTQHPHDLVIFLGDYVDAPWSISNNQIKENLEKIIQLKKDNPERVILLLGNHDIHYKYYPQHSCSGFRADLQPTLTELYHQYSDLFQVAYQHKEYLFSHAGVSLNWYKKYQHELTFPGDLADNLNAIHKTSKKNILHEVGKLRGGFGEEQHGGPTWADKSETQHSLLEGYHQVVGHSKIMDIMTVYKDKNKNSNTSITYCDCLDYKIDFLVLEI